MQITKAVKAFDRGKRIRRASWDKDQALGYEPASRFYGGFAAGAHMQTASGCSELYSFTLEDIRAEDWEIVKHV